MHVQYGDTVPYQTDGRTKNHQMIAVTLRPRFVARVNYKSFCDCLSSQIVSHVSFGRHAAGMAHVVRCTLRTAQLCALCILVATGYGAKLDLMLVVVASLPWHANLAMIVNAPRVLHFSAFIFCIIPII